MKTIEEIKAEMKAIEYSINDCYNKQKQLEGEFNFAREQVLLSIDSPLREDTWTLCLNDDFTLYLRDNNRNGFKKLRELYEIDYHSLTFLFGKYSLYFSDGEMTICADSNKELSEFIKTHNLEIKSKLEERLGDVNERIDQLLSSKKIITDLIETVF